MTNKHFQRIIGTILIGIVLAAAGPTACTDKPNPGSGPGAKDRKTDDGKIAVNPPKKVEVTPPPPKPVIPAADLKVKPGDTIPLPFIFWGGDAATFHANGGVDTKAGSIFDKHGLKFKLAPGDDFDGQIKQYKEGATPFLRGTMSMLGQVADDLGSDPRTRPVVFLQLTWSAGDHLVARGNIRYLDDLRGKTIALQQGGPHVGMLHDILRTARLGRNEVNVVWTKDVDGKDGPAEKFRADSTVDACFTISPEMADLTGGLEKRGDGKGKSISAAHVLVSTAHMSRSIADVYACRKDFYDRNRDIVDKLTAGYLKGCEELLALRKENAAGYKTLKKMTQDIFTKDKLPTDDDVAGLIDDATFVGVHGNDRFFNTRGNLSGFEAKQRAALETAQVEGDIKEKLEFHKVNFNLNAIKNLGQLKAPQLPPERFPPKLKFLPTETIYSFKITFQPDQSVFPAETYGNDFQRALEIASLFGKAGIEVRGHADPTNMLGEFIDVGTKMGVLRDNFNGTYSLAKSGARVDLGNLKQIKELMDKEKMPTKLRNYLQDLSDKRAEKVRGTVVDFAGNKGLILDKSQIRSQGAGAFEPAVARLNPTAEESARNRRVEFRIVRIASADLPPASDDGIDY